VKFGGNLPAFCSGVQCFAYLILVFSMGHGKTPVEVRILSADMVRHNHLGQSRMTFDQSYVAQENALQHANSLVCSFSTRLLTNFPQLVLQPIHYGRPKGFLRGKVAKHRCLCETDRVGNQLSADGVGTVFGHQRQHYLDNLLFAFVGVDSFAPQGCKQHGSSDRQIFNIVRRSANNPDTTSMDQRCEEKLEVCDPDLSSVCRSSPPRRDVHKTIAKLTIARTRIALRRRTNLTL